MFILNRIAFFLITREESISITRAENENVPGKNEEKKKKTLYARGGSDENFGKRAFSVSQSRQPE